MSGVDVSIIIPVFNRSALAREAIASVADSAGDGIAYEILVIDDGSAATEAARLVEACRSPYCRYVRQEENSGPQAARNRGLALAGGRYLKFLDSDDLLLPGALAEEHETIESLGADLLVSGWLTSDTLETDPGHMKTGSPQPYGKTAHDAVLAGFGAPIAAVLYLKRSIGAVRWDTTVRHPDDWFFLVKVLLNEPDVAVRENPVFVWRTHEGARWSATSQIDHARWRYAIMDFVYQDMLGKKILTPERRLALANYFYKDIFIAHRHDQAHYQKLLNRLAELDPAFKPAINPDRHLVLRGIEWILGYRKYIPLHNLLWHLRQYFPPVRR